MLPNPEMTMQLVKDHQRELLRQAELDRLVAQAHTDEPRIAAGALRLIAGIFAAANRITRFRRASAGRQLDVQQSLASTDR